MIWALWHGLNLDLSPVTQMCKPLGFSNSAHFVLSVPRNYLPTSLNHLTPEPFTQHASFQFVYTRFCLLNSRNQDSSDQVSCIYLTGVTLIAVFCRSASASRLDAWCDQTCSSAYLDLICVLLCFLFPSYQFEVRLVILLWPLMSTRHFIPQRVAVHFLSFGPSPTWLYS